MSARPHGRFIVLEGGDGAGKSTLLGMLAEALASAGSNVLETREPGGTAEGLALRALLLEEGGHGWDPRAELLLMIAARLQHVQRVIRPALQAGRVVLCDRFVGSTLAYQGGGRGLDAQMILRLHREMADDLWPEVTLLLDLDPATGIARSKRRLATAHGADEGRFEALDLDFHRRVRACYLRLAQSLPGWTVLDASRPIAEVADAACAALGLAAGGTGRAAGQPFLQAPL